MSKMQKFRTKDGSFIEVSEEEVERIMSNRKGAMIYYDKLELAKRLSTEQKGKLLEILIADKLDKTSIDEMEIDDEAVAIVYMAIQQGIICAENEYIILCATNKRNGSKKKKPKDTATIISS